MLFLPCEEVTRLVSQSLERKLPLPLRIIVWLHSLRCQACQRFQHQIRFLHTVFRHYPEHLESEEAAPPGLSPEARERIKRSLRG